MVSSAVFAPCTGWAKLNEANAVSLRRSKARFREF